jgi:hypothetical protein
MHWRFYEHRGTAHPPQLAAGEGARQLAPHRGPPTPGGTPRPIATSNTTKRRTVVLEFKFFNSELPQRERPPTPVDRSPSDFSFWSICPSCSRSICVLSFVFLASMMAEFEAIVFAVQAR